MTNIVSLAGLFISAFLAATIIPMQSEAVLAGLVYAGDHPVGLLLLIASLANTLGAIVNWVLGRFLNELRDRPWFPVSHDALTRAERWFQHYGVWSLLVSWAPIIGDPLTVAAGILRVPFALFLPLVATAKTGRYLVIAYLVGF